MKNSSSECATPTLPRSGREAAAEFGSENSRGHAAAVRNYVYYDCAEPDPDEAGNREAGEEIQRQSLQERREWEESLRQKIFEEARAQLWPEAVRQAETAMHAELERQTQAREQRVAEALAAFQRQRERYFTQLERDVVQLVLAIARKVMRREAQIDPLLLAGTVHVALEPLATGVPVTLVVPPSSLAQWRERLAGEEHTVAEVRADPALEPFGCRLETETGSTDLSLESQLGEIEQGFLDLLHRRTAVQTVS